MLKRLGNPIGFLLAVGVMLAIFNIGTQNFAQPGQPPGSSSQCSALLQAALESTDTECRDTTRNQACYGHVLNLVSPRSDLIESLIFEARGDKANLQDIASIQLSPLSLEDEHWGVVLMQVQANLPDSLPGQNVTFILFGDVQVENAVGTPVEIEANLLAASNIRVAPGDTRPVLASLASGSTVITNGKTMTGTGELWVRVNHNPEEEIYGWIRADLLDVTLDSLPDVQASDQTVNPMQAFYFKTGIGQPQCIEAPADGILVQTPKGAGKVDFKVNGMDIALGSTGYLTAPEGEDMSCVYLIEGGSDVEAMGESVSLEPGERTCVDLDEDGVASSSPSEPEPYDFERVKLVAPMLELLPDEVEMPESKPTLTPTFTPTNTTVPVVAPRNTATQTPEPSLTPTNYIPPNTAVPTAAPTRLPDCPDEERIGRAAAPCKPVANFGYGIAGKEVSFYNYSYGDITSTEWDFGDGNTSTDYSPTHIYANFGSYTVKLRVFNNDASDRTNAAIDVVDNTLIGPTASFTHTVDGFDVQYQDTSSQGDGTITNWAWDFGDGTSGGGTTGVHTYGAAGTYTLTLTVTDDNGLSSMSNTSLNFLACAFSTTTTTSLTVNRSTGDMTNTVYTVYVKDADCTPISVSTLSITNPSSNTVVGNGQHYYFEQTSPCMGSAISGIAGTTPITITVSDSCP